MNTSKFLKGALLAGGAAALAYGMNPTVEITNYTVSSPVLPTTFDGFKIAHLSDFHSKVVGGLYTKLIANKPDIIVCTGDVADDKGDATEIISFIQKLPDIAPTFIVSGNHDAQRPDFEQVMRAFCETGARVLNNERARLYAGDDSISIAGIADPAVKDGNLIATYIDNAIQELPPVDLFEILLFHRAAHFEQIDGHGFDLILSGHMHGGQIRLPYVGGILAPRSNYNAGEKMLFPEYTEGLTRGSGGSQLIVSRGLGNTIPIPRLFNRPELVMITLKSEM